MLTIALFCFYWIVIMLSMAILLLVLYVLLCLGRAIYWLFERWTSS